MTIPEQQSVPTHFLGICDECRAIKQFPSEKARDQWLKFHPHDEEL